MTKTNLGVRGLFTLHIYITDKKEDKAGMKGRNWSRDCVEHCPLAYSDVFHTAHASCPQKSGPSPSINNQEDAHSHSDRANPSVKIPSFQMTLVCNKLTTCTVNHSSPWHTGILLLNHNLSSLVYPQDLRLHQNTKQSATLKLPQSLKIPAIFFLKFTLNPKSLHCGLL